MNPQEIQQAVNSAIGDKILLSYPQLLLFVLLSGVAAYLGAYLKKKGENLATSEDVNRLTREVENIKTTYSKQIEDYKAELARRNHASRIAEILAQSHYKEPSAQKFAQLAWELSIWLPPHLVQKLSSHLVDGAKDSAVADPKQLLIAVRKLLHGESDELTADQIIHLHPLP